MGIWWLYEMNKIYEYYDMNDMIWMNIWWIYNEWIRWTKVWVIIRYDWYDIDEKYDEYLMSGLNEWKCK